MAIFLSMAAAWRLTNARHHSIPIAFAAPGAVMELGRANILNDNATFTDAQRERIERHVSAVQLLLTANADGQTLMLTAQGRNVTGLCPDRSWTWLNRGSVSDVVATGSRIAFSNSDIGRWWEDHCIFTLERVSVDEGFEAIPEPFEAESEGLQPPSESQIMDVHGGDGVQGRHTCPQ